jgi:TNF receptor-associated protein 1
MPHLLTAYSGVRKPTGDDARCVADLKIVNAEEDGVELPGGNANDAEADDGEEPAEALSTAETEKLCGWIQKVLSESKVKGVRASTRLTDSPAMLVGHQSAAVRKLQQVQLQMAAGHKDATAMGMSLDDMGPIGTLEINPSHPIMRQLSAVYTSRSETTKAMAEAIVFQLFDNSKIAAGVLDDPRSMLERLNKIMAAAVPAGRRKAAPKTEATDTSAE